MDAGACLAASAAAASQMIHAFHFL
ncbi:hypothetical protein THICB1_110426 [Thiomonas arsenitoxydans]|uniref:Uncharacterized protein n=1 Tax=Thiomonas arsenitoxydans (strain DSM 22701 / CIP 110005 / 3As) TaxID=426114 RepID=A0ABP1Z3B3_THIA3|nr:hypothetical protein ACO7_10116 [Thiomonas arsenitoxydans]CQR28423.1 hypothetical protein ACO3_10116 [Thiomonas arsenitoxydans]CQR28468.1 hypothetical protein THICB1_110426 [Thiomonas arsenitoxydans]CQR30897.1 hypothetical protein THICB6_150489 [Thiomonas arsenitoxydans]